MFLVFLAAWRSAWRRSESIFVAGWIGVGGAILVISCTHIAWLMPQIAVLGCIAWAVWETQEVVG